MSLSGPSGGLPTGVKGFGFKGLGPFTFNADAIPANSGIGHCVAVKSLGILSDTWYQIVHYAAISAKILSFIDATNDCDQLFMACIEHAVNRHVGDSVTNSLFGGGFATWAPPNSVGGQLLHCVNFQHGTPPTTERTSGSSTRDSVFGGLWINEMQNNQDQGFNPLVIGDNIVLSVWVVNENTNGALPRTPTSSCDKVNFFIVYEDDF